MRKTFLLAIGLILGLASTLSAQVSVSGNNIQSSGGGPLYAGQWCAGATCLTISNGSFTGSVTAGTYTVTVVNASSVTILSVSGVVIGGSNFNWNLYTVPYGVTFTGNGQPYLPCQLSALYTQLDSSPANAAWYCVAQSGQLTWKIQGPPTPAGPGLISGLGVPTMTGVVPTIYVRTDVAGQYSLAGETGTVSSTWVPVGTGNGCTPNTISAGCTGGTTAPTALASLGGVSLNPTAAQTIAGQALNINLSGQALPTLPSNTDFSIFGASGTSARSLVSSYGGTGYHTSLTYGGTASAPTAVTSGQELGGFNAWAYDGTAIGGPSAAFRAYANQNWTVGAHGTYADVAVTPNGSTSEVEVAQFTPAGMSVAGTVAATTVLPAPVAVGFSNVYEPGDSLVAGGQNGSYTDTTPYWLGQLTSQTTVNLGVPATTTTQVATGIGAETANATGSVTIPTCTTGATCAGVGVTFSSTNNPNIQTPPYATWSTLQWDIPGTLAGVAGFLSCPGTASCLGGANYVFTPSPGTSGGTFTTPTWQTVIPNLANSACIWEGGYNNAGSLSTIESDVTAAETSAQTGACFQRGAIEAPPYLSSPAYAIGGGSRATIDAITNWEVATYPAQTVNLNAKFAAQCSAPEVLNDPESVYDCTQGLTPAVYRAQDVAGTLNGAIADAVTCNINVTGLSGQGSPTFPSAGYTMKVDSEKIWVLNGTWGSGFTSCTRGFAGTTATTHSNGAAITAIDGLHLGCGFSGNACTYTPTTNVTLSSTTYTSTTGFYIFTVTNPFIVGQSVTFNISAPSNMVCTNVVGGHLNTATVPISSSYFGSNQFSVACTGATGSGTATGTVTNASTYSYSSGYNLKAQWDWGVMQQLKPFNYALTLAGVERLLVSSTLGTQYNPFNANFTNIAGNANWELFGNPGTGQDGIGTAYFYNSAAGTSQRLLLNDMSLDALGYAGLGMNNKIPYAKFGPVIPSGTAPASAQGSSQFGITIPYGVSGYLYNPATVQPGASTASTVTWTLSSSTDTLWATIIYALTGTGTTTTQLPTGTTLSGAVALLNATGGLPTGAVASTSGATLVITGPVGTGNTVSSSGTVFYYVPASPVSPYNGSFGNYGDGIQIYNASLDFTSATNTGNPSGIGLNNAPSVLHINTAVNGVAGTSAQGRFLITDGASTQQRFYNFSDGSFALDTANLYMINSGTLGSTTYPAGGVYSNNYYSGAGTLIIASCTSGHMPFYSASGTLLACLSIGNNLSISGSTISAAPLTGTTGTITGTALTATCDSGTVTVPGAATGNRVMVSSTTGADVGGAFNLRGSVTSANTVTVYICGTGTPASLAYNVTVLQ